MGLSEDARRFNDPVTRAALLREEIRRKSSEEREATARAIREREKADRDGDEERFLSSPVVPDGIVQADGSIHYLTDQEKEVERQRIEKFMAERGL
jgi:hypothetical protein